MLPLQPPYPLQLDASAASAILRQFERLPEGYNYFRLHPKGRGMLVARPGGLEPFTFVEEYLGEVHAGVGVWGGVTGGGGWHSANNSSTPSSSRTLSTLGCWPPTHKSPPLPPTPLCVLLPPPSPNNTPTPTHPPSPGWRWFEIQDAIKKITQKELPDFYNITLERPKDDPDGYDVVFVDAAFMGSFASRMSHSCSPNCQVGGKGESFRGASVWGDGAHCKSG